jgi:hypothetical protein
LDDSGGIADSVTNRTVDREIYRFHGVARRPIHWHRIQTDGRLGNSTGVSGLDEGYRHQMVAPAEVTQHVDPAWAERCYHLLFVDGELMLDTGRALNPHAGTRKAFAGISTGREEHALRAAGSFSPGDDPDRADVGPLRIEVVRPLEELRLVLDAPDFPVSFDLSYTARFAPVATEPNRIEVGGEIVTDYMNFFQSGVYSGTVVVEGSERTVADRSGFRDRGWGLRKHEGAPRRGLVLACFCELPDSALYLILYETASGRRAFTNGWLIGPDGVQDVVTGAEHDLGLDGTLLRDGRIELAFRSGISRTLELDVRNRLFLSAVGYSADPAAAAPGQARHDITDPAVVAELDGQVDHGCAFRLDGASGHGYVETGMGVHERYRPEQPAITGSEEQ